MAERTQQPTCEERIEEALRERLSDLRQLWAAYQLDPDEEVDELGTLNEYGLGVWYVAPQTYPDQDEGWICWQLSTGGPGDEFRFFISRARGWHAHRVEYVLLDWFDGASRQLHDAELELLREIFGWLDDAGVIEAEVAKATAP